MNRPLRIIVTGLVGLYPVGGVAWDYMQYVLGLHRLGHDVYYHEDTWSWPYHPVEQRNTKDGTYSADFIRSFFDRYAPELSGRWHYLHLHDQSHGMARPAFDEVARTADLFLNVSGACLLPNCLSPHCIKLFLDTDPGYNQIMLSERHIWSENVDRWADTVAAHDLHFTYAENIDEPDCQVPRLGFDWKTTRMPVTTEFWEVPASKAGFDDAAWTTVMTWSAFKGPLTYRGAEYHSKGYEFEKVMDLPRRINVPLCVAVGGKGAPMDRLARHGWQVTDAPKATLTPERYWTFITESRGEFSIAKHVYVTLKSGWFSCRSACYLASGRPVVVQDTGFSRLLPTGEGLLAFSTLEEAADALARVEADYDHHCAAARTLAREHFDARLVLTKLLQDVGLA